MKFAKLLINNIFIPVFTALLFLVGLLAAFISALIEYSVFEQFYESSYLKLLPASIVAFALILSFEYTKIYLHYFLNRLKENSNNVYKKKYAYLKMVKHGLVLVSLLCSMIYSVSSFYLSSYNENEIDAQITEIENTLENDIITLNEEQEANYKTRLQPYEDALQSATTALENFNPDGLSYWQANMQRQTLEENLSSARATYDAKSSQFTQEKQTLIEAGTTELTNEAQKEIDAISNISSNKIASKYDNPIIAQFLTVLANTLLGAATYSRLAYLIFCIIIGIFVSVILEIVISFTFSLLSDANNINFADHVPVNTNFQKWSEQLIVTFVKAFCALTVYIIIVGMFSNNSVTKNQFWIALTAYMLAICMSRLFSSGVRERGKNASSIQMDFILVAKDATIQGILSFAGYLLLGFIFGKDAITLDLSTIAIGLGAAFASFIGKIPEKVFYTLNSIQH